MPRMEDEEVDDYLEWVIEQEFVLELEKAGWKTLKGDKLKRGFSDQFCFGPGATTIIIEFKRMGAQKKRKGEKLQDYYRSEFAALGFRTMKVVGMRAAYELLDELLEL